MLKKLHPMCDKIEQILVILWAMVEDCKGTFFIKQRQRPQNMEEQDVDEIESNQGKLIVTKPCVISWFVVYNQLVDKRKFLSQKLRFAEEEKKEKLNYFCVRH